MKKALALVLALVMVLSLGVSAFALTLKPVPAGTTTLKPVTLLDETSPIIAGEGTEGYLVLDLTKVYENIELSTTGAITAEIVEYDPEVFEAIPGVTYAEVDTAVKADDPNYEIMTGTYEACKKDAKASNDYYKTTRYAVICKNDINMIHVTVADNYGVAYDEGTITVKANEVKADGTKVAVKGTLDLIRDVTIFKYEEVKWAAENDKALVVGEQGYSDYVTATEGYKTPDLSKVLADKATVVSTTEFRAIEGKDLKVSDGKNPASFVTIKNVAKGQKGVNFEFYGYDCYTKAGKVTKFENKDSATIKFGFCGDQVIASDFTITLNPNVSYFALREAFGKKIEEDDIITYYILKDGKKFDEFTVDYMTVDYNDDIELVIEGKAGSTLGQYEITLAVPANEGEENPNTGAESMIGVVAALAVVSVATAAAVSLKK